MLLPQYSYRDFAERSNPHRELPQTGTAWDSIIYDPEAHLVYVGTGNGSPCSRELRSEGRGDNLFLSSIVALNVDTGAVVWHYQTTPGDDWDYTATQPLMTAELVIDGQERRVIMQAPKNGLSCSSGLKENPPEVCVRSLPTRPGAVQEVFA